MRKFSLVAFLFLIGCSQKEETKLDLGNIQWIDLSYAFDSTTLYWPNNLTGFVHTTDAEGITPLGYFYSSYSIFTPEHGGTHLDAPIHFAKDRLTIDQLPMTSLTGNAVVIDVSENALKTGIILFRFLILKHGKKNMDKLMKIPSYFLKPDTDNSTPTVKIFWHSFERNGSHSFVALPWNCTRNNNMAC